MTQKIQTIGRYSGNYIQLTFPYNKTETSTPITDEVINLLFQGLECSFKEYRKKEYSNRLIQSIGNLVPEENQPKLYTEILKSLKYDAYQDFHLEEILTNLLKNDPSFKTKLETKISDELYKTNLPNNDEIFCQDAKTLCYFATAIGCTFPLTVEYAPRQYRNLFLAATVASLGAALYLPGKQIRKGFQTIHKIKNAISNFTSNRIRNIKEHPYLTAGLVICAIAGYKYLAKTNTSIIPPENELLKPSLSIETPDVSQTPLSDPTGCPLSSREADLMSALTSENPDISQDLSNLAGCPLSSREAELMSALTSETPDISQDLSNHAECPPSSREADLMSALTSETPDISQDLSNPAECPLSSREAELMSALTSETPDISQDLSDPIGTHLSSREVRFISSVSTQPDISQALTIPSAKTQLLTYTKNKTEHSYQKYKLAKELITKLLPEPVINWLQEAPKKSAEKIQAIANPAIDVINWTFAELKDFKTLIQLPDPGTLFSLNANL